MSAKKTRSKSVASDYEWIQEAESFAHKKNRRFISVADEKRLGLIRPKISPAPAAPESPQPAQSAPALPAQPVTAPAPEVPKIQPSPAPEISQAAPQEVSQDEIFSAAPAPTEPAQPAPENPDAPQPPPEVESGDAHHQQQAPPSSSALAMNLNLANMVWGMLLKIFILIFGDGVDATGKPNPRTAACLPQIIKTGAIDGASGKEIELDENKNVISAFCEYFNSIGFVKLTPLWNLILTLAMYFLLRIELVIIWFKNRKARSAASRVQRPEQSGKKETPGQKSQEQKPEPAQKESPQPQRPPLEEQLTDEELNFANVD